MSPACWCNFDDRILRIPRLPRVYRRTTILPSAPPSPAPPACKWHVEAHARNPAIRENTNAVKHPDAAVDCPSPRPRLPMDVDHITDTSIRCPTKSSCFDSEHWTRRRFRAREYPSCFMISIVSGQAKGWEALDCDTGWKPCGSLATWPVVEDRSPRAAQPSARGSLEDNPRTNQPLLSEVSTGFPIQRVQTPSIPYEVQATWTRYCRTPSSTKTFSSPLNDCARASINTTCCLRIPPRPPWEISP